MLELLNNLKEYIIAGLVAFVGSGTFYAIIKGITARASATLANKLAVLEEQNKISSEAKAVYEEKIKNLEDKLIAYCEQTTELQNYIKQYIEVDKAKEQEMANLLEYMLPVKEEEQHEEEIN